MVQDFSQERRKNYWLITGRIAKRGTHQMKILPILL